MLHRWSDSSVGTEWTGSQRCTWGIRFPAQITALLDVLVPPWAWFTSVIMLILKKHARRKWTNPNREKGDKNLFYVPGYVENGCIILKIPKKERKMKPHLGVLPWLSDSFRRMSISLVSLLGGSELQVTKQLDGYGQPNTQQSGCLWKLLPIILCCFINRYHKRTDVNTQM